MTLFGLNLTQMRMAKSSNAAELGSKVQRSYQLADETKTIKLDCLRLIDRMQPFVQEERINQLTIDTYKKFQEIVTAQQYFKERLPGVSNLKLLFEGESIKTKIHFGNELPIETKEGKDLFDLSQRMQLKVNKGNELSIPTQDDETLFDPPPNMPSIINKRTWLVAASAIALPIFLTLWSKTRIDR